MFHFLDNCCIQHTTIFNDDHVDEAEHTATKLCEIEMSYLYLQRNKREAPERKKVVLHDSLKLIYHYLSQFDYERKRELVQCFHYVPPHSARIVCQVLHAEGRRNEVLADVSSCHHFLKHNSRYAYISQTIMAHEWDHFERHSYERKKILIENPRLHTNKVTVDR